MPLRSFRYRKSDLTVTVGLAAEATEAWWLSWSSKPAAREQRAVGSIPIRFRHRFVHEKP